MNEKQTASMLQRLPVILAVTAGSYGLPMQATATAQREGSNGSKGPESHQRERRAEAAASR